MVSQLWVYTTQSWTRGTTWGRGSKSPRLQQAQQPQQQPGERGGCCRARACRCRRAPGSSRSSRNVHLAATTTTTPAGAAWPATPGLLRAALVRRARPRSETWPVPPTWGKLWLWYMLRKGRDRGMRLSLWAMLRLWSMLRKGQAILRSGSGYRSSRLSLVSWTNAVLSSEGKFAVGIVPCAQLAQRCGNLGVRQTP